MQIVCYISSPPITTVRNIISGLDEAKGQIYFKYSVSALSDELTRLVFDWAPRVNVWEHVCFMKKPDKEGESNQLKFFVNGENKGKGKMT